MEVAAPAAASAAVSNSVFVLIWLVFMFLCVRAISQNGRTVSTLFCLFLNDLAAPPSDAAQETLISVKNTVFQQFWTIISPIFGD
jgi:hypothetical protein